MSARSRLLLYAALFLFPLLLYYKTTSFSFIPTWDDGDYILRNPYIQALTLSNLWSIFSEPFMGHYSPLQLVSYALDYRVCGLEAHCYHLSNVLLHAANTCAAYLLVNRVARSAYIGVLAALLFAAHPVNVENVAWVAERKTLLSGLLFLLAFYAHARFRDTGSYAAYIGMLLLGVGAIVSKSTAVVLPLLIIAYDYVLLRTRPRWGLLAPLVVASVGAAAATLGGHSETFEQGVLSLQTLFNTVYPTTVTILWKYVGLLVLPLEQSGYYDTQLYRSFLNPVVVVALVAWIAVTVAVFLRGSAQLKFWYLWYWICLLPVSNIIPINTFYADRYQYLPAIGFFVIAGLGLRALVQTFIAHPGRIRAALAGITAVLTVSFAVLTSARTEVWRTEIAFWEDTARKSPGLYKPHLNLGVAYERQGRFDEAEREYREAARLWPGGEGRRYLRGLHMKRRAGVARRQNSGTGTRAPDRGQLER